MSAFSLIVSWSESARFSIVSASRRRVCEPAPPMTLAGRVVSLNSPIRAMTLSQVSRRTNASHERKKNTAFSVSAATPLINIMTVERVNVPFRMRLPSHSTPSTQPARVDLQHASVYLIRKTDDGRGSQHQLCDCALLSPAEPVAWMALKSTWTIYHLGCGPLTMPPCAWQPTVPGDRPTLAEGVCDGCLHHAHRSVRRWS
ncbi:hypothetical protein MRB53_042271 [Persea americana]|nr:hypothetical protein MRB53_042271 [Persea americana]